MYSNSRNKHLEDLPKENTLIWCCTKEGCKGWMRDNFAFDKKPVCFLCKSPMVNDMRMLPTIVNSNDFWRPNDQP